MRGVFDDEELEPVQPRRDTELTLGSGTLLAIFFGLVLVCGLCFGLGYALGRHSSARAATAATQSTTVAQQALQTNGSRAKPSAIAQPFSAAATQTAGTDQTTAAASGANPAAGSQAAIAAAATGSPSGQSQVQPALASVANPPQPAQPAAGPAVRPALAPVVPLMVQIAAVANPEDADVLVNALRKRGYAVLARREPADNLIHVRIGPFNSREDALRWRQKLLNDGYNAIVLP
jgi:hypothetical protein